MTNRRPNDLDEYLVEVEDDLFCISAEDRECLLRDLKAHVRELTTDPDQVDRFTGMYGINRNQLLEELGEPRETAFNYVASVPIVSSRSLLAFLALLLTLFGILIFIGIGRIITSYNNPGMDQGFLFLGGVLFITGGILFAYLTIRTGRNIAREYALAPFLVVFLAFVSIPISYEISRGIVRLIGSGTISHVSDSLFWLILCDLFAISMLGLYVAMEHIKVIGQTRAGQMQ